MGTDTWNAIMAYAGWKQLHPMTDTATCIVSTRMVWYNMYGENALKMAKEYF